MSRVYTDTIEPRKPTQDITLGTAGETITLPGNDLRVNTVKDKGGNTLWTSDGSGNVSSVNAGLKGNFVLLSTQTASNVATVSFTTGIDSTYDVYIFKYIDINPAVDDEEFCFQADTTGTSYAQTITSTSFTAYHNAANTHAAVNYEPAGDQAQGTAPQRLGQGASSDADHSMAGTLYIFNPSSTTYVKHFHATTQMVDTWTEASDNFFVAGYFNTTSALTKFQFSFEGSGNFDGTIKMYGIL